MRSWRNSLLFLMNVTVAAAALAQTAMYNLGRAPTNAEIRAWDITVSSDGKELLIAHQILNETTEGEDSG